MITTPVKLWRRQKDTAAVIGKTGVILQWTIIRIPPRSFVQEAPYPVVIVSLGNGKKMIGQLVDYEEKDLIKGRKVVTNPSGGLKACGHPVGATGIKQIVEIVEQLRGNAGKRQVKNAKIGLTHNVGGSGAVAAIHILKKV